MSRSALRPAVLIVLLGLLASPRSAAAGAALLNGLHPETSPVTVMENRVRILASPGLWYLNALEARTLLEKAGNPPDTVSELLGLLLPQTPAGQPGWYVTITENTDGHVGDAGTLDVQALLTRMQAATRRDSRERVAAGFDPVAFAGWAQPPAYDPVQHSVVWAGDLVFGGGGSGHHTLNYAVRLLGRKTVLELNAVGSIGQLPQIRQGLAAVLSAVHFTAGNRYSDYRAGGDPLAPYGLAGVVEGKVDQSNVASVETSLTPKGMFVVVIGLLTFLWRMGDTLLGWIRRFRTAALARRQAEAAAASRPSRSSRPPTFPVHPDLSPPTVSPAESTTRPTGRHGGS